jgi:CheY-like chemotaxis protein
MDGYELAQRLRASLNGRPCPFMVAVTGYGLPEDPPAAPWRRDSTSTLPSPSMRLR